MVGKILANDIIFEIHEFWNCFVTKNQFSTKLNKDLWMFVKHYTWNLMSFDHCYKIMYLISNWNKITLCMSCDKINGY